MFMKNENVNVIVIQDTYDNTVNQTMLTCLHNNIQVIFHANHGRKREKGRKKLKINADREINFCR